MIRVDDLEIDLASRQVRLAGEARAPHQDRAALLEQLVTHPGKLLTHQYLLRKVWGRGYGEESNYLRVYVGSAPAASSTTTPPTPALILTEPGMGYRWIAERQAPPN